MYNKSFDDVVYLIEENNFVGERGYIKRLLNRLRDDDIYDIRHCLDLGISPDCTRFPTFDYFLQYVYQKCYCNIYYFLRNIIKIPAQGGGFIDFHLNIGTLSFIEHYLCGRNVLLENPRQTLQSTTAICVSIYESLFRMNNADIEFISNSETQDKLNKRKRLDIIDNIPKLFRDYIEQATQDGPNRFWRIPKTKIIFIDNFEFCDMSMIENVISSGKSDYEGGVQCYATSTINGNLKDEDVQYIERITFDVINDFNTICLRLYGSLEPYHMDRVWYDSMYFFTEEKSKELQKILGPDVYKHEILRVR